MKYDIKTPNVGFTGIREGIAIQDGRATTDDQEAASNLKALGYSVEPDPDIKPKAKPAS